MSAFELIRDLHKDARGFRPSQSWMEVFNGMTDVDQESTWNSLCDELEQRNIEDAKAELTGQRLYETRIEGMVADYGISRADAIRWDLESFDVDIEGAMQYHGTASQEIEFFLYKQGISTTMFSMYVAEICNALGLTEYATEV